MVGSPSFHPSILPHACKSRMQSISNKNIENIQFEPQRKEKEILLNTCVPWYSIRNNEFEPTKTVNYLLTGYLLEGPAADSRARRPAEILAADHVHMQVEDGLARLLAVIDDKAVCLELLCLDNRGHGDRHHVAEQRLVLGRRVL